MNEVGSVVPILIILLLASIAVLLGGIRLAARGSGTWKTVGWWVAIVSSLFVVAFSVTLGMGFLASASQM